MSESLPIQESIEGITGRNRCRVVVVTGNAVGLFQDADGVLLSRKNNTVEGNGVDEQGHIVFYPAR